MPKSPETKEFKSVAEFMEASGMTVSDLAEYLDVDYTEALRLKQGRVYRSLIKPMRIAKKCKMPIERLAPPNAA